MEYSDLFLSYRRKDVEFVKQLDAAFKKEGREVWIDWEDIPPGSTGFSDDIKRGIEGADAFVAVLSPDYLESTYCVDLELGYAVQLKKRIIPIVHRKFEGYDVPESIASINWVYFTPHAGQENAFDEAFLRVMEAMDSDYEHARTHTRLFLRAQEWDGNNRKGGYLLDGEGIEEAEMWIANAADKKPPPTDLHKVYIQSSRQMRTRRLRTIITWVSVSLIFTILLAVAAVFFWIDASNQRQKAEANLALAQTSEANAYILKGEAENNEATAVAAQSLAEQSSEQSQSLALAASALLEYEHENNLLAVALAMQANNISNPSLQVQRLLQDIAFAPGVRYWLNQPGNGEILATDGMVNLREEFGGYTLADQNGSMIAFFPDAVAANADNDAISPNGQYIINVSDNRDYFTITNNQTGETTLDTRTTPINHGVVNLTVFSPDSNRLMSADAEGTIWTWDLSTGDYREQLHNFAVGRIFMSLDGRVALTIGSSGAGSSQVDYLVWDTATGAELARFEESTLARRVRGLSEDGRYILFEEVATGYTVWDTQNGMLSTLLPTLPEVSGVEFLDDNLLRVDGYNESTVYDVNTGATLPNIPTSNLQDAPLTAIVRDNTLVIQDAITGADRLVLDDARISDTGDYKIDFDAAGTRVVYLGTALILVRDIATGELIADLSGITAPMTSLSMSPDGRYVAGGYLPSYVVLWDVTTGDTAREYSGEWEESYVDFSPDGNQLAIASQMTQSSGTFNRGMLMVWNLEQESQAVAWTQANRVVRDFTCDERALYSIEPICAPDSLSEQSRITGTVMPSPTATQPAEAVIPGSPTPTGMSPTEIEVTDLDLTPADDFMRANMYSAQVGDNTRTADSSGKVMWTYAGRAGELLDLSVQSADNAHITLFDPSGNTLAESSDGASELTGIILPVSGDYRIEVQGSQASGEYRLMLVSR